MKNFQMRNQQLKKLTDEFIAQSNERPADAAVVMLGDFNLSPWSAFYTLFEEKIEGKVSNIFKNEKPVFTRSLRGQKIVNAHIDHVFVSPNVTVGGLVEVNNLAGSDHRAISFDVMNWSSHIRKLQVL
jgi:endonuclease/exonuclease/phosphatase (EEP) superfamily protein YafD